MSKKRDDECFFCNSRKCSMRIWNADFDEVACGQHGEKLAAHADEVLKGAMRWNCETTGRATRKSREERIADEPKYRKMIERL